MVGASPLWPKQMSSEDGDAGQPATFVVWEQLVDAPELSADAGTVTASDGATESAAPMKRRSKILRSMSEMSQSSPGQENGNNSLTASFEPGRRRPSFFFEDEFDDAASSGNVSHILHDTAMPLNRLLVMLRSLRDCLPETAPVAPRFAKRGKKRKRKEKNE